MKHLKHWTYAVLMGLFITPGLLSQEVISSAGSQLSNANYHIDWTLGEVSTITIQNQNSALTQGFNQPQMQQVPIPTLGEWGLIILSLSLLITGTVCIKYLPVSPGNQAVE